MDGGRELLLSENIWGTEIWLNILSEEEKTGHLDPVGNILFLYFREAAVERSGCLVAATMAIGGGEVLPQTLAGWSHSRWMACLTGNHWIGFMMVIQFNVF